MKKGNYFVIFSCWFNKTFDFYLYLGIAFPVCISANGCICHFSPITSEPDHIIAKDDVLKMYVLTFNKSFQITYTVVNNFRDLGVHLDGFISMIAHTIVVGANSDNKITDKKANCFLAAHYASQAALRLMRPGNDVSISLF
jgi:methionine aminopeptidase